MVSNSWLKENWFKVGLLALLVVSASAAFYWFQLKPAQIRKECIKDYPKAFDDFSSSDGSNGGRFSRSLNFHQDKADYAKCLVERGLEK